MSLFGIFIKDYPNKVFVSTLLGICAGLLYVLMIPLIMMAVGTQIPDSFTERMPGFLTIMLDSPTSKMGLAFLLTLIGVLAATSLSQYLLVNVSLESTFKLRLAFYQKISKLPIQKLEKIGPSRLLAVLTSDVPNIIRGAVMMPGLLVDMVTVVGILGFLISIHLKVFYIILIAIVFGVVTYQIPMYLGFRYFQTARSRMDALHESIRGLIYGAKELKLSRKRREDYYREDLVATERWLLKNEKKGETVLLVADNYGRLIVFFTIGAILFYLNYIFQLSAENMTAIVIGLLYLTTPIDGILRKMSAIQKARVALIKFNAIYTKLPEELISEEMVPLPTWETFELRDVEHDYQEGDLRRPHSFSLGPLSLKIQKGKVLFLVGGNGSGKSTLGKILSLHYLPKSGDLRFDDTTVNDDNRNSFRECISSIYSDFYLFKKIIGVDSDVIESVGEQYLKEFELDHKVDIDENAFSTLDLSDGQKKRLALIVSFLEDRDLYLFDEWAADQDPTFKEMFYKHILQKLRQKGKAVVVISHDDRYFHLADTLVRMESGKVIEVSENPKEDPITSPFAIS